MKLQIKKAVMIGATVLVLFIVSVIVIFNSYIDHNPKNDAFEIQFPMEMDATVTSKTQKIYDVASLQTMVEKEKAYIYYAPSLTDYSIVKKLDANFSEYSEYEDYPEVRLYLFNDGDADERLEIDKYGCFTYSSSAPDTSFEYPFTDEQTLKMAKEFLKRYNLLDDSFTVYSISGTMLKDAHSEKIVARKVEFLQKLDDKDVHGNNRMGVEFNGNGEVTDAYYYVRKYEKKRAVDLISVEEALQRIDQNKALIDMDLTILSSKLTFEKVSIAYWTNNLTYDHTVVQPIYIFEGTSQNHADITENFKIAVQANVLK